MTLSLLRLPLSVGALALTGTWIQPPALPVLWPAVLFGYAAGRYAFTRMDVARYERAVLTALVAAALVAMFAALT